MTTLLVVYEMCVVYLSYFYIHHSKDNCICTFSLRSISKSNHKYLLCVKDMVTFTLRGTTEVRTETETTTFFLLCTVELSSEKCKASPTPVLGELRRHHTFTASLTQYFHPVSLYQSS